MISRISVFLIVLFVSSSVIAKESSRLAEIEIIKNKLSLTGDKKDILKKMRKISKSNNREFAVLIEDESKIDEIEELMTYVYFNQNKVDKNVRKIVLSEFPNDKEGVLRLTTMWRKRGSEESRHMGGCNVAIDYIKEKANLTQKEIDSHYKKTITKKITKLFKKYYGKKYKKKYINGVVKYYLRPTMKNLQMLSLHAFYSKDEEAYDAVILKMSKVLLVRYSHINIVID